MVFIGNSARFQIAESYNFTCIITKHSISTLYKLNVTFASKNRPGMVYELLVNVFADRYSALYVLVLNRFCALISISAFILLNL